MTISYPLSLPAAPIAQVAALQWSGESTISVSKSPFSKKREVFRHAGQLWMAQVTLPAGMLRADAEEWNAFLFSCDGQFGTFLLGDPAGKTPRGSVVGSPLVDGGSQVGLTLATKGWTFSAVNVLRKGDYIQLGTGTATRLHKVLNDVTADGAGLATLDIWPRLRESPADNDALTTSSAKGTFALAENSVGFSVQPGSLYSIGFSAVEAI